MRKTHRLRSNTGLLVGFLALLVWVPSASAQDEHQIDLSAGYLHVNDYMHGWNVQLSRSVTRHWELFFEVDGAYGPDYKDSKVQYHDHYLLGGSRWSWQPNRRFSLFTQAAAGAMHSLSPGFSYIDFDGLESTAPSESANYFVVQPGGGVTTMITRRVGIRTQLDLPFLFSGTDWMSSFGRVLLGTTIRLGTMY